MTILMDNFIGESKYPYPNNYVPLYFSNRYQTISFEGHKIAALKSHIVTFRERMKDTYGTGKDLEEVYKLMSLVKKQNGELESVMQSAFNDPITGSRFSGITINGQEKSFASFGRRGSLKGYAKELAKNLASNLNTSSNAVENVIEEMQRLLSQRYKSIEGLALSSMAISKKNIDFIQDVITSGQKFISVEEATSEAEAKIQQDFGRLLALARAIPMIKNLKNNDVSQLTATYSHKDTNGNKSYQIKDKGELLSIILGKIGGILSSLGGAVEEIAVAHGLDICLKKVAGVLVESMSVGENTVSKTDPLLTLDATEPIESFTMQKEDVSLTLCNEKVIATFGVTVKTKGVSNGSKHSSKNNIKLQDETNLSVLLRKIENEGVSANYILSLAGGRQKKNETGLLAAWIDMVDYGVKLSFLDALAGNGSEGNNAVFLIYNRQIYSIREILHKVISSPNAINYTGGKQRFKFVNLNNESYQSSYVESKDGSKTARLGQGTYGWALERSSNVAPKLLDAFRAEKIRMMLNMSML